MSKPVKEMIRAELQQRLGREDSVAICNFTGLDAVATNLIRGQLLQKDMRVAVVKNSLARAVFRSTGHDEIARLLEGPCAVVSGGESVVNVVRELLEIQKKHPALTVKAATLAGDVFGADQIDALSKYPTREEAIAKVLGGLLGAGGGLLAAILGPGGQIGGILKTIEEKQAEGEQAEAEAA